MNEKTRKTRKMNEKKKRKKQEKNEKRKEKERLNRKWISGTDLTSLTACVCLIRFDSMFWEDITS